PSDDQRQDEQDDQTHDQMVGQKGQGALGDRLLHQLGVVDVDVLDEDGTAVDDRQPAVECERETPEASTDEEVGSPENGGTQTKHHRRIQHRQAEADRAEKRPGAAHVSTSLYPRPATVSSTPGS